MSRVCPTCGKAFESSNLRRKYCSNECQSAMVRKRERERNTNHDHKQPYHWLVCPDCGCNVWRHIKSKRCAACQAVIDIVHNAERRKALAAGHTRKLGEQYPCSKCGNMYVLRGSLQKYCSDCAPSETRKNANALSRKWNANARLADDYAEKRAAARTGVPEDVFLPCKICGKPVSQSGKSKTYCSDACKSAGKRQAYNRYTPKRALLKANRATHDNDTSEVTT